MKESAVAHLETLLGRYPVLAVARDSLGRALALMTDSLSAAGKLLICGNGGSASDSEHIAGELMKGFCLKRRPPESDLAKLRAVFGPEEEAVLRFQKGIPALSLNGHPSLATAIGNDLDPYLVYAQQVYVLGRGGDVLLGLSTSGNARNVINACKTAKAFGLIAIGLCGGNACKMDAICDCVIHVPEVETYRVQELHLPVYHALCLALEEEFFGE